MAHSVALTPLKVRGKRRGAPAEKWNTGKRRKAHLQVREVESHLPAVEFESAPSTSQKSRRSEHTSPLEMLPAEVVQMIFEYSGNVDLPVVSNQLSSKLSKSQHLYKELSSRLLEPVLGFHQGSASAVDIKAACRLMNSRFFSWNFFKSWLQSQTSTARLPISGNWQALWTYLGPSTGLLPPKKLLNPPFTGNKMAFLSVLIQGAEQLAYADAAYVEIANNGLGAAVEASNVESTRLFLSMGLQRSTELLRTAVEAGCDENLVTLLLSPSNNAPIDADDAIDLLDPVLWQWAETARRQGNVKGPRLVALLRDAQGQREQHSQRIM